MPTESFPSWLHTLLSLLRDHEPLALFAILFVEEAGIPLPAPGDLLIMFAGYRASMGEVGLLEASIAVTLGVQLGSALLYIVARKLGHNLLFKYGRVMRLERDKLERVEAWIQRRGAVMVYIGRLTPGLRIPSSIMAGVFEVPFAQFLFYTTLSALTWCAIWLASGYFFGSRLVPLVHEIHGEMGIAGFILVGIAALAAFVYLRSRQGKPLWGLGRPTNAATPLEEGNG